MKMRLCTLIICIIALRMQDIGEAQACGLILSLPRNESDSVANGEYLETESGNVFLSIGEHVEITAPSPKVQKLSSSLNVSDVLRSDRGGWWDRCRSPTQCGIGRKQASTGWSGNLPEIESLRQGRIAQFAIDINAKVLCGSLATIPPFWPETPIVKIGIGIWLPVGSYIRGEDKGALFGYQRLSREKSLPTGGDPQRSCESGDDNGGESGNTVPMVLKESARASHIPSERDTETGWLFFGGIATFAVLFGGYTLLEGWRERPLSKDRYRRQQCKER
jgi:hypothetical protein